MPSWLVSFMVKMLAQEITSDNIKGLEKELLMVIERAVQGNADEVQVVAMLASALGIKLDPV